MRSALVWLGKADPVATMENTREEDPQLAILREVLQAWSMSQGIGRGCAVRCVVIDHKAIVMESSDGFNSTIEPKHLELNAAVRAAAASIGAYSLSAKVDALRFGQWCKLNKERIVDGLRLKNQLSKRGGAATWWVERMDL